MPLINLQIDGSREKKQFYTGKVILIYDGHIQIN